MSRDFGSRIAQDIVKGDSVIVLSEGIEEARVLLKKVALALTDMDVRSKAKVSHANLEISITEGGTAWFGPVKSHPALRGVHADAVYIDLDPEEITASTQIALYPCLIKSERREWILR